MTPLKKEHLEFMNNLSEHFYGVAAERGFHSPEPSIGDFISNLHSEVSELWEAYRKNALYTESDKSHKLEAMGYEKLNNVEEELADIIIRALDTAKTLKVDIAKAIALKDAYNQTREYRHGNKLA